MARKRASKSARATKPRTQPPLSAAGLKRLGVAVHWHGEPACKGGQHSSSCASRGTEIRCQRIAASVKGKKLAICACVHLT